MSPHRSFATAIAALLIASPLAAQGVSPDTSAVTIAASAGTDSARSTPNPLALLSPRQAPAWTNVDVGARETTTAFAPTRSIMAPQRAESGTMMVVGGAALLVGAIIGGKAGTGLMVGGAVFGLVGLWTYLK
jgi:hypothetical protein